MKRFLLLVVLLIGGAVYHFGQDPVIRFFADSAEIVQNTSLTDLLDKKAEAEEKIKQLQEDAKSAYEEGEQKFNDTKKALEDAQKALSEIQEALEKINSAKSEIQGVFGTSE